MSLHAAWPPASILQDGMSWTSLNNLRQASSNTGNISCAVISRILDPLRPQKLQVLLLMVIVYRQAYVEAHAQPQRTLGNVENGSSWKCSCGQGNSFNGLIWEL